MSGYRTRTGSGRPALKGNLALKSSPLNPSSGKSVSQDLVIDHMNAHYKKLLNAKSAVDSSVPKAYLSSQKVRDRQVRDSIIATGKKMGSSKRPTGIKPSSARNSRPGSARSGAMRATYTPANLEPFTMDDVDYQDFTQDEINCINAMVNDTIDSERIDRMLNGTTDIPHDGRMSASSGSMAGQRTSRGMAEAMSMNTLQRKNMSADILDKRTHVFSEPQRSFTPRTLRNSKYKDVPSKLSQTKHFRPAKKGSSPPTSRSHGGYAQSATESEILDETLMSRDFSTRMTMSGAVPKLDISIDQDHMKWLQEQSARHESKDYHPLDEELAKREQKAKMPARNGFTRLKIQKEEEELCYLDFIGEVTNDVLTRGIFTNRVLRNVFEEHVEKNKGRLDEDRMRGMLDNLREDLGIPAHDSYREDPNDVGMGSSRPQVRSSTKTTGYTGDPSQFRNVKVGGTSKEKSIRGYGDANGYQASTDYPTYEPRDISNHMSTLNKNQSANTQDLISLTDIAEVSEKTASVSSIHSQSSTAKGSKANSKHTADHKSMDDMLVDLLGSILKDGGFDDAGDKHLDEGKGGMETMSIKSTLSSHTSDKVSKKSSVDPLAVYGETVAMRDQADKLSVNSHTSKASRSSTYKDDALASTVPKPLPRQSTHESSSRHSASRQTSVESRNSRVEDKDATPVPSPRHTSSVKVNYASEGNGITQEKSRTPSQGSVGSVYKSKSRRFSEDSTHQGQSDRVSTDGKLKSSSRQSSVEDEREDLESNIEFGKTTMFAKTKNLDLTYKALSQVSDDVEDYNDNFSDKCSDEDF